MTQTVLILGANGRFGGHSARAFAAAGWNVRRFDRAHDDLDTAMTGVDVVVSAWNPPGYHLWTEDLMAQHQAVAAAAARHGATVILPGNVYVYGPEAPSPWREDTPHLATNPLGLFRKRLEAAYRDSGARTIVLRCGDFIDTEKTGNWFETNPQRSASNNSAVIVRAKATRQEFDALFEAQKQFGEPGFYFVEDAEHGANLCVEIGLNPKLTVTAEVEENSASSNVSGRVAAKGSINASPPRTTSAR